MTYKRGNSNKKGSFSKGIFSLIIVILIGILLLILFSSSFTISEKSVNSKNFLGTLFSAKGGNINNIYYCDKDHDGYISNSRTGTCKGSNCLPVGCTKTPGTDCNDLNANVWMYKSFYTDNDHDSFGTGSLINVCSNGSTPYGYSSKNQDCNDNNSNMNPNVSEVCTNGIDDNCNGLTDSNDPACQTQCTPTKSCTDYPNQCGNNLNDGCNNVLDCSNSCQVNYNCISGTCVLSNSSGSSLNATTCSQLGIPNCIEINDAWLSSQGSSPYYLNKTGATYLLMKDVNTDGTAFAVLANNITLDLNGYTITYDDATPVNINNGDFELQTGRSITGWDFSKALNFTVTKGTYVQPVSAFSGSNSVFISSPCPDQSITSNTFTLDPYTTYVLSANLLIDEDQIQANNINPDLYANVLLYVTLNDPNINITKGPTWRRFSHNYYVFTTGPTAQTYYLTAGVKNSNNVPATKYYIDNIRISRYDAFGVLIGATSWKSQSTYPGINLYTSGIDFVKNVTVKNGVINQGKDNGEKGSSIVLGTQYNKNIEISNLQTSVRGANSKNIDYNGDDSIGFLENLSIHDNTFNNYVTMISNRMLQDGTMVYIGASATNSKIYNNNLIGGSQIGILMYGNNKSLKNYIYNNKISLNSRFTNDFAITANNAIIHDNIVDCGDGEKSCRGIFVNDNDIIYNNNIRVQQLLRNQEYNGCEFKGAYGMQAEATKNSLVYNNNVSSFANVCEAHSFRANPAEEAGGGVNLSVHDNTFTSIVNTSSNLVASSIMIENGDDSSFNISNNVLSTNMNWIYFDLDHNINMTFRSNTFELLSNIGSDVRPIGTYNAYQLTTGIRFIDNIFKNSNSESYFKNSSILNCGSFLSHSDAWCLNNIDSYGAYTTSWTYILNVLYSGTSINGASIIIKNSLGNTVYSGNSVNGKIISILDEYNNKAGSKTNYNNYVLTVNDGAGHTCTKTITITKSSTQTIDLSNCIIS